MESVRNGFKLLKLPLGHNNSSKGILKLLLLAFLYPSTSEWLKSFHRM